MLVFAIIFSLVTLPTGSGDIKGNIIIIVLCSAGIISLSKMLIRGIDPYPKLAALLSHYCLPEVLIIETQKLLGKEEAKDFSRSRFTLMIYLSKGYYAAGRFHEALSVLKTAEHFSRRIRGTVIARFYNLLVLIYVELGNLDMAREALGKMTAVSHKLKGKVGRLYKWKFVEGIYLIRVATGIYENAEKVFVNSFKSAQTNYDRVTAAFTLGRLYEHFGQNAETQHAYKYVAEHGEKLYIAKLAVERLGVNETA